VSYALCGAGVVLLLACWWRLRSASTQTVLLAATSWAVPLLVAAPLFSRDVYAYAGQAHLVDVGLSPYKHGPADASGPLSAEVDDVWRHSHAPYGPVFLRVASWLVPGEHVVLSVLLLRLLAVAGLALLAWSVLRLAREPARAVWLCVANPLVLLHGIAGAHNDAVMGGLLMAGVAVAAPRQNEPAPSQPDPARSPSTDPSAASRGLASVALGALLVTVAALVKAPAVVALAFLPFLRPGGRARSAVVVAAAAALTALVGTAVTGLGWGWLHTLGAGNARRSLLSISTGVGVAVSNVTGESAITVAHALGLGAAAAAALVLLLRAGRRDTVLCLGLALLALVVLGPVAQPWYLLWVLPLLAATVGRRAALGLGAASALLCLLILPSGRHVIRPPLYGLPAALALAAGYAASRSAMAAEMHSTT
jgi:alpha-1,6-mannosyltransferase